MMKNIIHSRRRRNGGTLCLFPFCLLVWTFAVVATRHLSLSTIVQSSDQSYLLDQVPYHGSNAVTKTKHNLYSNSRQYTKTSKNIELKPRAFKVWKGPLPCFPAQHNWNRQSFQITPTKQGFMFVKPFKCASSTVAGVQIRIAHHIAKRQQLSHGRICQARFTHGPQPFPAHTLYSKRDDSTSFLWTILREPTARAVSGFFHFRVSKQHYSISNFQQSLLQADPQAKRDYYLQTLYLDQKFNRQLHDPIQVAQAILDEYNFIGIVERLDESLVVLMLLLQLPMADILFVSAKRSGASYDPYGKRYKCTYLQPAIVTSEMQTFLESDTWYNEIQYDVMLYEAANESLDLTIDRLGRDYVQTQVDRFREAQKVVEERCHPVLPCDEEGRFHHDTDCLWKDSACGMQCLDEVANDLDLW